MIAVEQLRKRFDDVVAVDDLSFEARPGKVTALLGPNGAGKTTALRVLLSLARADRGRATIDGHSYSDLDDPFRRVGALIEQPAFHPGRTARTHLRVLACASGISPARVDHVLADVDLGAAGDRRVGGFSTGMQQRLGLAAALLGNPGVVVLDEPQNGLDPHGTRWLRGWLRRLADEGRTVLVSSHLLSEMELIADDIVIVDHGRLVQASPLVDLGLGLGSGEPRRLEDIFVSLTDRETPSSGQAAPR